MCSTNVVFNIKTVENVLIFFLEFLRLKHFFSLFSKFFSLNFFTLRNCMPNTHKHRLHGSDGTDRGVTNAQIAHAPCLSCNQCSNSFVKVWLALKRPFCVFW